MFKTAARYSWLFVFLLAACGQKDETPPEVKLEPDKDFVDYNGSIVITWWAEDTNYCKATGDWVGNLKRSGSKTLGPLTRDSHYVLDCYHDGEKISRSVTVKVGEPRIPEVRIAASPLNIPFNGETTVSWTTQHVTDCQASGDWSGKRDASGSMKVSGLGTDSDFRLVCQGADGELDDSVSVKVFEEGIEVPFVSLTANPMQVRYKGSTTLSWNSSGADICRAWGNWTGSKGRSGTEIISQLSKDSRFILVCTQAGGRGVEGRDAVEVTVQNRPPGVR